MSGSELKETARFKLFKSELIQKLKPHFGKEAFGKLARSFVNEYLEAKGLEEEEDAQYYKYIIASVNAKNGVVVQSYRSGSFKTKKPKKIKILTVKIKPLILAAKQERKRHPFYDSRQWFAIRYEALKINGAACQCCGRSRKHGIILHVDHIKPRANYPHLELELSNLQVLCNECNLGKSNVDATDWRTA